ncbi:uncharacterized protein [Paramormyrops kingsleyae]|uniref:S100P-binding protein n=2 Tax=Paramormyrops kingsleyae TaxID=1676925 RepID=A0A3B3S2B2_9TELE|nr:uncharacterized protein LOC111859639 isoform X2 [Paramormyrops kingsleyae]XP_023698253.1 uncharacterized protein LOC111859639 isoform X2 [Paramormyrops kingsleyae]
MGASPRPEKGSLARRVCLRSRRYRGPYDVCPQRAPPCSRNVFSEQPLRHSGKLDSKRSVPLRNLRVVFANVQSPGGNKPLLPEVHTPPQPHQRMWSTPDPRDSSPALETTAPVEGGQTTASTPCPEMRSGRSAHGSAREGGSPPDRRCRFDLDADDILCLSPIVSDDSGCAADVTDLCFSLSGPEVATPSQPPSAAPRGDALQDEGYIPQEALSAGAISIGCIIQTLASQSPEGREADQHGEGLRCPAQPQVRRVASPGQSEQSPSGSTHRALVFSDQDWQQGKRQYVDAVLSHSRPSAARGAVEELYNLIDTVGQQGAALSSCSWQHPADLTRRNYGKGRNKHRISLDRWYQLNSQVQRRFASVPLQFRRSPVL